MIKCDGLPPWLDPGCLRSGNRACLWMSPKKNKCLIASWTSLERRFFGWNGNKVEVIHGHPQCPSQSVPWSSRGHSGCDRNSSQLSQIVLVGGIPTPLKNMKVSWDGYSQYIYIEKNRFQTTNQCFFLCQASCWGTNAALSFRTRQAPMGP